MRCTHVQGLFSEVYDGVAEEQAILEKHIQECPACAAEYKSYSKLLDELKNLPMPELPVDFHEKIMAKVRAVAASDAAGSLELTVHKGRKPASNGEPPQKKPLAKTNAAVRRWASVAAAACVLLVSLWGIRVFDVALPGQRLSDSYIAPTPVTAPMPMYDAITDARFNMQMAEDENIDFGGIVPESFSNEAAPPMGMARAQDQETAAQAPPEAALPPYEGIEGIQANIMPQYGDMAGGDETFEYVEIESIWDDYTVEADPDASYDEAVFGRGAAPDAQSWNIPRIQMAAELGHPQVDSVDLPLTGGQRVLGMSATGAMRTARDTAWIIALAIGIAALGISLAAIALNIHRKKG